MSLTDVDSLALDVDAELLQTSVAVCDAQRTWQVPHFPRTTLLLFLNRTRLHTCSLKNASVHLMRHPSRTLRGLTATLSRSGA